MSQIIFNIDVMLAKRKMSVTELSERVGITLANMSILKNGKAKAIKALVGNVMKNSRGKADAMAAEAKIAELINNM